jgi:hypothetical protein
MAAGLIQKNSNKANVECRIKEFMLFHSLKKAERHAAQAPALRERHPPFVNLQSSFVIPSFT